MTNLNKLSPLFGFQIEEVNIPILRWIDDKLQDDKVVGAWTGKELVIHCIPSLHAQRLKRWHKAGENLESKFIISDLNNLQKCMDYFAEGDIDYIVCDNQFITFRESAKKILPLIQEVLLNIQENNPTIEDLNKVFPSVLESIKQYKIQDAFVLNLIGKLCSYYGHSALAARYFRESSELQQEFGEPFSNLGTLLWNHGKRKEAYIMFSEGVIRNPYGISCQLNFFDSTYDLMEFDSSIKVIELILQEHPELIDYKHQLAVMYSLNENKRQSKAVLTEILDDNPKDQNALNLLNDLNKDSVEEINQGEFNG